MKGKKISAHVVGAAVAVIIVWTLDAFAGMRVPGEVAVAFGTVAAVIVSVLVPDEKEEE